MLDALGYATWRRWRVYGEESLAGEEATQERTLTLEHAGEPLSRYEVEFLHGTGRPMGLQRPVLFGTTNLPRQPKLFGLESLGVGGWLKAMRLDDYAPRRPQSGPLQQSLFPYHKAWG